MQFLKEEILVLTQLHPNHWAVLVGFFTLCKKRMVEPTTFLLHCFYRVRTTKGEKKFAILQKLPIKVRLFKGGPQNLDDFETEVGSLATPRLLEVITILAYRRNKERIMQMVGCKLTDEETLGKDK